VREARATDLAALIEAVRRDGVAEGRLYLVAGTSLLAEGWPVRASGFELTGDPGALALESAVRQAAAAQDIPVTWESPGDVVPLPDGAVERARAVPEAAGGVDGALEVRHFDPYSVVLRLIARGDEHDYVVALEYLRQGWVDFARLEALLAEVLPRLTSETLAQDPAEFRRKFRGLRQLHVSEVDQRPGVQP